MAHSSYVVWMAMVISLLMLARSQTKPEKSLLEAPQISSSSSLIWRRAPASSSACEATMTVDEVLRRCGSLRSTDRVAVHQLWSGWWGYDARGRGRRPASIALPWLLLAEWRSFLFLPAQVPKGRPPSFWSECVVCRRCCGGDLVAPTGFVPAAGRFNPAGDCQGPDCVSAFLFLKSVIYIKICRLLITLAAGFLSFC